MLSTAVYKPRPKIHHYVSETDITTSVDPTPEIHTLRRIKIQFNFNIASDFCKTLKAIYYFILKDHVDVKVSNPELNQEFKSALKGY